MEEASENMDFEKAISYRDKTRDLEKLKQSQVSELSKNIDEDIFYWCFMARNNWVSNIFTIYFT